MFLYCGFTGKHMKKSFFQKNRKWCNIAFEHLLELLPVDLENVSRYLEYRSAVVIDLSPPFAYCAIFSVMSSDVVDVHICICMRASYQPLIVPVYAYAARRSCARAGLPAPRH